MFPSRPRTSRPLWRASITPTALASLVATAFTAGAAPAGPTPQVPEGGGPPGAFPNTSVTAVNVIARGSTTFNSSVDIPGLDGQGPIPWSVNRYNRGDIALRLSPGNPTAALGNLGQGFIEFGDSAPTVAASQAWRPAPGFGVVLVTARQNGPINWNDGEGPFYPTVGVSWASSGPGYNLADGSFGTGQLDINTGRAGTHASSPEANFSFSTTWFPYDQGWLGGDVGSPTAEGGSTWSNPSAHATGLSAGIVKWTEFPAESATWGGLARLVLPGVNALEDGMIFAASSDGGSDVNIVGVAPEDGGAGWVVTVREDSEIDPETLAAAGQSEFQFVYVPFDAVNLVGGHVVGATGVPRKSVGTFQVSRTGTGTYELTFPGKTGSDGTLLLQVADFESGTSVPMASRAFLSYEYRDGKFVVQSRRTTSDTNADLVDANFYVAWVDFKTPLSLPDGVRLRSVPPVVVSGEGVVAKEAGIAASTHAPEVLVTSIDSTNPNGLTDPVTGQPAAMVMVGRFYDSRTLAPLGDAFPIVGVPAGTLNRTDVKYNPVSKQYVAVANARGAGTAGLDVPVLALINPPSDAALPRIAKAWVHHPDTDESYDDVALAVSSKNGNFILAAERKFTGEGEGAIGSLYDKAGTRLTDLFTRLDLLQQVGDEDDPDVVYLEGQDAFLYVSNTDNSNGSTGTLGNRIVGSLVGTAPDAQGKLVVRPEHPLGDGLPAGRAEGHPASIQSPFNAQIITAYDGGNGTAIGDLSYTTIGAAPEYVFTPAMPEVPYLDGSSGNPFNHQHPQLAADASRGVIALGLNAVGSTVGIPDAYAFVILGPDGKPLPSQLGAPYLLADSPGGISTSVNYHQIQYSPGADAFVVAYSSNPGLTYLASFQVTSSHLAPTDPPKFDSIKLGTGGVTVTWSGGGTLLAAPSLSGPWTPVANAASPYTTPASGDARFFRVSR